MLSRRSLSSSTTRMREVRIDIGRSAFCKNCASPDRSDTRGADAFTVSGACPDPTLGSARRGRGGGEVVGVGAVVGDGLEQVVEVDGLAQTGGERELVGDLLPVPEAGE